MIPPGEAPRPSADGPSLRPPRRPWGRRKRSLHWVLTVTAAVLVVGGAAGVAVYQLTRPEVRRPGEDLPEITRKLAKGLPADAPLPRFADVTAEAGLAGFSAFAGPRSSQLPEDMGAGLAWGDYDGDGDDDLFLVSAGGALGRAPEALAPSELYKNLGDGTFRRVETFPDTRIHGMAAAWGDYDGDGRLDLAVTGYGALLLFHNEGEGRFVRDLRLPSPPGFWAGASWGDYDLDRDLDLYVAGYVRYVEDAAAARRSSRQYGKAVPYTLNPASYEPERNLLFRNDGNGSFTEVAAELEVDNPAGRSLGVLWHDFDGDGRLDLYVANDISDNALFRNEVDGRERSGRFADISLAAWVADYRGAMGLAAGDWNRDGDDDLFITHWIAQENALYDSLLRDLEGGGAAAGPPAALPAAGTGPGSTLSPAGAAAASPPPAPPPVRFSDVASPLGLGQIALRTIGWGAEFADFDGDGWLDLAVANGSTFEEQGEPRRLVPQTPFLFWNRRGEHFHDLAPLVPALAEARVGRGLAVADYDLDGDLDLGVVQLDGGVRLLRNDMQTGHWLALRLRSRLSSGSGGGGARGFGDGATVTVRAGGAEMRRTVGGASYLSQSSRTLHFGLGAAAQVDAVEVRWLGGAAEIYSGLAVDAGYELTEGDPVVRRLDDFAGRTGESAGDGARLESDAGAPGAATDRERLAEFWRLQRSAMDAMKRDGDLRRAIDLFRQALAIDPAHEDARYYLASCLALEGEVDEALDHLAELQRRNPQSHRAFKQWGRLKALAARSDADLAAAERSLERALELNKEETGSLLLLGQVALLRGDPALADQRLEWACRTNPRAVGGLYLRAYLAWRRGEEGEARRLLAAAHAARGPDWKPAGAVAEGDVAARMHRDETPLARFWEAWDGTAEPPAAFSSLDSFLN